ncbi:YdcF family protein [Aeromicrobium sp. 9AM]|uniref:YdcF family protein n=1 Tax=Aeromicrobium sp. 9AM TaxID=2653126 RepID=UPI00191647E3|nr:YdcF family protein [Aeromicrobium sp. 9AM]
MIVVLGFRNAGSRINLINRWRVRIGLRSVDDRRDTLMIFSGGSTRGRHSEAELMGDYAAHTQGFGGRIILESQSRSTWENVANSLTLIENFDRIKIASQPAHALKARIYLRRQRPDLAARVARARDHRVGEWLPLKPLLAVHGLWTLRRVRQQHL